MMMTSIKINPEQKKAIIHKNGPLLVVAGAGTGKTTVITEKIRYLIEKKLAKPTEILALTFTEKASGEMLKRIDEVMPLGYEEPWLSTFHAFCDRILQNEALEIGLNPAFKILTEPEQWLLIRKHLFEFELKYYRPLGNPTKFISALLQLFSRAKDEIVSADEFLEYAKKMYAVNGIPYTVKKNRASQTVDRTPYTVNAELEENQKLLELANAYKKYQELLITENAMDFGDLLLWTIKLFKKRPSVLLKYQKQFKYILIDEFQDTNYAQFEIIKLLAPTSLNPNLTVVGDDDQAIYRFRGAAISNILEFIKDYPKTKTVVLTKNYRSTQKILNSAYSLIQNNNPERLEVKLKIDKKLQSTAKKKGNHPFVINLDNVENEADFVANTIKSLINENLSYGDFAILARANNHLDPFIASLKRNEIPYSLIGNRGLFDQEEIRSIIAFLRILANSGDNISVYQLLLSPVFNIPPEEITTALNKSKKQSNSLWNSLKESGNASVKKMTDLVEGFAKNIHQLPVTLLVFQFLTQSGYIKKLTVEESLENILKIKNINIFFNKIKAFESSSENPKVHEFIDYLNLLVEAGENPAQAEIEDIDTVKLMTVHSSKGLEFPVVFMANLVSDRFPTRERSERLPLPEKLIKEKLPSGDFHLSEERRLFYVGLTRAKSFTFLTWAKNYGGIREKKPSIFLSEIIREKEEETNELISNANNNIPPILNRKKEIFSIINENIQLKKVSYSQLETYNTCPLKYYYKYILGVVGTPSHALNFGQTLHRTLRDFHKADLFTVEKSMDQLINFYENHFRELASGYTSIEHRSESHRHGIEILEKYFSVYKSSFGRPVFLEQRFSLKIGAVLLIGSIDRIDQYDDQSFEIIDYKSGSGTEKSKNADKDAQLTIYAIAAREHLGITPDKYSLYFLESNTKVSSTRNAEQIDEKKTEILNTVSEIKKGVFKAKTGPWCNWCEFNKFCPAYKVGQNSF